MKTYSLLLILASAIFATSCVTTKHVGIQVREPALVTFPSNVKNVLLVDNIPAISSKSPLSVADSVKSVSKTTEVFLNDAKKLFFGTVSGYLSDDKFFDGIKIYPQSVRSDIGHLSELPLTKSQVQSLCQQTNTDAVIAFDLFGVSAEYSTQIADFYSMATYDLLKVKMAAVLNVYTKDGMNLTPRSLTYVDSLYWNDVDNPSLPPLKEAVGQIIHSASDVLVNSIVPPWNQQNRIFFVDAGSAMKKAAEYAKKNDWKAAAILWDKEFDKQKNTTKKIRLAFNIALANENMDDVHNAVLWINLAYSMINKRMNPLLASQVIDYRNILLDRQKKLPQVELQLGESPVNYSK